MELVDVYSLTNEDLIDEYLKMYLRLEEQKEKEEKDKQQIYNLKRNLETAKATQTYLTQELDQLTLQLSLKDNTVENKLQEEVDELRIKYKKLKNELDVLQAEHVAKTEHAEELQRKLDESLAKAAAVAAKVHGSAHDDCYERFTALENENIELLQKLSELQECNIQQTFTVAEKEKSNEILLDQVSCLQENLRSKRDELEEKLQMLESAQDQLVEANAKIARLTSAPTTERKGNSLFAEVDDQRQAMKKLLAAQKKSYLEMKKNYNESEFEIRRLKRENIAMHTELETCSTIFCSADKTYQDKLNERVRQLLLQTDKLERKLNWTQDRLKDLAGEKAVLWLDSMLDFCKQETEDLKMQLYSSRIQKASLEEQLRNALQDMARWRFESLKSRCVLTDRENLLTEHKITFKPNNALEFNIKEAELRSACPRIITPAANNTTQSNVLPNKPVTAETPEKNNTTQSDVLPNEPVKEETPEEAFARIKTALNIKLKDEGIRCLGIAKDYSTSKTEQESVVKLSPRKIRDIPLNKVISFEDINSTYLDCGRTPKKPKKKGKENKVVSPLSTQSPSTSHVQIEGMDTNARSILTKNRDIFVDEQNKKNVKFSEIAPTVHDISLQQTEATDVPQAKESMVKVRRIVVGSKKEKNNEKFSFMQ